MVNNKALTPKIIKVIAETRTLYEEEGEIVEKQYSPEPFCFICSYEQKQLSGEIIQLNDKYVKEVVKRQTGEKA